MEWKCSRFVISVASVAIAMEPPILRIILNNADAEPLSLPADSRLGLPASTLESKIRRLGIDKYRFYKRSSK